MLILIDVSSNGLFNNHYFGFFCVDHQTEVSTIWLIISSSSAPLLVRRPMSSANWRLFTSAPFSFIPALVSLWLSDITASSTKLNSYGDKIHPCRTAVFVFKYCVIFLSTFMALDDFQYIPCTGFISCSDIPAFCITSTIHHAICCRKLV